MIRIGQGFDVHALVPGRRLIIGGVDIPHDKGLLGHSDADVLLHAITDALLGAAALGDIGSHFPDTDERWRGADSRVLLLECTFLDGRKSLEAVHAGCHIHLDELVERAHHFRNQHLVLMHVSQMYRPGEIAAILDARLPQSLRHRVQVLAPASGHWPG